LHHVWPYANVQISQSPAFEENDHVEQNIVLEMNQQMEEDDGFQPLFDYSKVYDSPPKFQEDDSDEEEVIISTQQRYGATKRCAGNMLTKVDYNTSC
jgi:hypothetical protein